jgi:hypothetical protein
MVSMYMVLARKDLYLMVRWRSIGWVRVEMGRLWKMTTEEIIMRRRNHRGVGKPRNPKLWRVIEDGKASQTIGSRIRTRKDLEAKSLCYR